MLKIRTFILALSLTPLLAINWQLPSQSQTSPSVGTAGSMSGGGTTGAINTSPSVGTAGGISGGGNTSTSGNTVSNPDPSVGTAGGQSGGGTTGSNGTTDSNPSVGTAGGQSGGGTTGSNGTTDSNPSVGTAGGQSGGGTTGSNGTTDSNPGVDTADGQSGGGATDSNPSVGTAGGQSGGGTTGSGDNTASNPDTNVGGDGGQNNGENNGSNGNNQGNNNNSSGPVENLVPRASSITVSRTPDGNILRITFKAQTEVNTAAANLLNGNNPNSTLVAIAQGGSIGQTASNTLTQFLSGAGVNPEIGGSFATILRSIIVQSGKNPANVDINQLNNAINTYNRIIRESSPVTLQTLSQNQDFAAFGSALRELRAAVQ